jgi:hypothetical protein
MRTLCQRRTTGDVRQAHPRIDVAQNGYRLNVVARRELLRFLRISPLGWMARDFIVDLARLNAGSERPRPEAMREMFTKYDMEIVGPPLPKRVVPK